MLVSSLCNFMLFNIATQIPLSINSVFSFEGFDLTIITE